MEIVAGLLILGIGYLMGICAHHLAFIRKEIEFLHKTVIYLAVNRMGIDYTHLEKFLNESKRSYK